MKRLIGFLVIAVALFLYCCESYEKEITGTVLTVENYALEKDQTLTDYLETMEYTPPDTFRLGINFKAGDQTFTRDIHLSFSELVLYQQVKTFNFKLSYYEGSRDFSVYLNDRRVGQFDDDTFSTEARENLIKFLKPKPATTTKEEPKSSRKKSKRNRK
jgi:hypothetical protein